jgi:hypothetical protein
MSYREVNTNISPTLMLGPSSNPGFGVGSSQCLANSVVLLGRVLRL